MKTLVLVFSLILITGLGGCATNGPGSGQQALEQEWPSGFGTIPPSWYNYDPAYRHWFDPWYINPYTPR